MTNVNNILADTSNRQYPLPEKKWKYFQEWHDTLFFHWKVAPDLLHDYIPEDLELDVLDDYAWVSLVAFEVRNMRLRNLPPFPYVSHFHEINIRTYVVKDGIPGIYLFSIETDKFIEVLLTNLFIGLPYRKTKIKRTENQLLSGNDFLTNQVDISFDYKTASEIKKTETDFWLTERHSLYEKNKRKTYRFDIHHKKWELKKLDASISSIKYNAGKFNLNINPDSIQYSEKIDVVLWGKEIV